MRSATGVIVRALGVYAGLLGATHGVLEIPQGSMHPGGLLIQAIGPPCQMTEAWHGYWPAVTLVVNYLVTGVLALLVSLTVIAWSALPVKREHGGLVLILLSIDMLPVGGGNIPLLIGIIAGAAGIRISTSLTWWRDHLSSNSLRILSTLWPWLLIAYFVWIPVQWILGLLLNEFMLERGFLFMLLEFALLLLGVVSAFANDSQKATASRSHEVRPHSEAPEEQ